ncbi:MAG: putative beta-lysine N-acetyltransferase [Desulfotomaculaceae bacterium]|nr:putative beta-lysine N-acetyltransferase [Desulfotomaculaceae bacterium]
MHDIITSIGNSLVQHGNYNDRIYLMKLSRGDFPDIIDTLDKMAQDNGYSKIFAKVPQYAKEGFIKNGFIIEANIPDFYNGEQAFFLAKFFNNQRRQNEKSEEINMVLEEAQKRATASEITEPGTGVLYRICGMPDAPQMVQVYKKVFETYPFPIHNPDYIVETMNENVIYFGIWRQSKIVALSSAEMDIESCNAEMTDFATLPGYRGKGLSSFLLQRMEAEMRKRQIKTAYTIARALSFGMNITFAKMGYRFSGTLINNTNISGRFESMNVWYKSLLTLPEKTKI